METSAPTREGVCYECGVCRPAHNIVTCSLEVINDEATKYGSGNWHLDQPNFHVAGDRRYTMNIVFPTHLSTEFLPAEMLEKYGGIISYCEDLKDHYRKDVHSLPKRRHTKKHPEMPKNLTVDEVKAINEYGGQIFENPNNALPREWLKEKLPVNLLKPQEIRKRKGPAR